MNTTQQRSYVAAWELKLKAERVMADLYDGNTADAVSRMPEIESLTTRLRESFQPPDWSPIIGG